MYALLVIAVREFKKMAALAPKYCLQLCILLATLTITSGASENKTETAALLSLRDAVVNWPLFAAEKGLVGWNDSAAACGWTGVTCTDAGRVIFVDLPCGIGCKTKAAGMLPASLCDLEALGTLDLNSNDFYGSLPPKWSEQGRFPVLQDLLLQGNNLSGAVPWHGASFPLLKLLRLEGNQLQGTFPDDLGLPCLRVLRASGNKLDGMLSSKLLGNMPLLQILALQNNLLAGKLLLNWTSATLEEMDLQNNNLTGGVPASWGLPAAFPDLVRLDLSKNPLGGGLPAEWNGPMLNLQSLNLSSSLLTGELPAAWAAIGALPVTEDMELPKLAPCSALTAIDGVSQGAQKASDSGDRGLPVSAVAVPVSVIGALAVILAAALLIESHRGRKRRHSIMAPSPSTLEGQSSLASPFAAVQAVDKSVTTSSRRSSSNVSNDQPCSPLVTWLNELVKRAFSRNGNGSGNLLSTPDSHSSPHSLPRTARSDVELASPISVVGPRQSAQMSKGGSAPKVPQSKQSSRWAEPSENGPETTVNVPVSDWEIDPEEIEIMRRPDGSEWVLGHGDFCRVYKGLHHGVQPVAVKKLKPGGGRNKVTVADFKREIALLRTCRDANIVMFVGAQVSPDAITLVMECMEGGDLMDALAAGRVTWWRHGRKLAIDVVKGLTFLHARNVAHFDLKSSNVLLTRDRRTAKICDMGMARVMEDGWREVRGVATAAWSAPELLAGESSVPHTLKADIYSLGVIIWEICSGDTPEIGQLRDLIVPEEGPAEVRDLILECLDAQPARRPTAAQVAARLLETPEAAPNRSPALGDSSSVYSITSTAEGSSQPRDSFEGQGA